MLECHPVYISILLIPGPRSNNICIPHHSTLYKLYLVGYSLGDRSVDCEVCSQIYRFTLINNSGNTFFPLFFVRVCGQITCSKMGWCTIHKNMCRNAELNNEIQRTMGVSRELQHSIKRRVLHS